MPTEVHQRRTSLPETSRGASLGDHPLMEDLDHHELLIDLGCEILLLFERNGVQFEGNLIGLEKDNFIIVKPKPLSSLGSTITKGDQAQALYLCDGTVYAFRSTLIHLARQPLPLFFLSFPARVKTRSFRNQPRVPAFLPASARLGGQVWTGALLDMCQEGLRFACAPSRSGLLPRPRIDDRIEISTCRLIPGEELNLEGKIRNFKEYEGYLTLGVKLRRPSCGDESEMAAYLDTLGFLQP